MAYMGIEGCRYASVKIAVLDVYFAPARRVGHVSESLRAVFRRERVGLTRKPFSHLWSDGGRQTHFTPPENVTLYDMREFGRGRRVPV